MRNSISKKFTIAVITIVSTMLLCAGTAMAQPQLDLKTSVGKEVKVKKEGKLVTEVAAADQAGPKDTLVFTIKYTNSGDAVMTEPVIINPVPKGMIVKSKTPAGNNSEITASVDGGQSFKPLPVMVQMKQPDGSLKSVPAKDEQYTHIRWAIKQPLQAGQSGEVSFKTKVI